jgi:hypothetical protein
VYVALLVAIGLAVAVWLAVRGPRFVDGAFDLILLALIAGAVGLIAGQLIVLIRILRHPWEFSISPSTIRLTEAGRTWTLGWDEISSCKIKSIYGQSAVMLGLISESTFPRLTLWLQRPGPMWYPRRNAVVVTFPAFHRGGMQPISAALRRAAGPRWEE